MVKKFAPGILGDFLCQRSRVASGDPGEDKPADPFLDRSSLVDVVV